MNLEKFNLENDIYFVPDYGALYLKCNEAIFEFAYNEGENRIYTYSIKRKINNIGSVVLQDEYYDLETPYGYGGFLINTEDRDFITRAFKKYQTKCLNENIIAEFTRFHVFNNSAVILKKYYDFYCFDRNVTYVDLEITKDQRWRNYSSTTRNILRKCQKELTFNRTFNIAYFIELYYKTMSKNQADDFYYFNSEYFENLIKLSGIELYEVRYNDIPISMSFFMFSKYFCHYHLSANDYRYCRFNSNYYLLDSIFEESRKRSKKYCILGGGRTDSNDDSLLKFKRKFSPLVKPFFIAGKVFNKSIYEKYINLWESQNSSNINFFLKYRLGVK